MKVHLDCRHRWVWWTFLCQKCGANYFTLGKEN